MARRRTKRTRRNPIRTTGALIINPRRRKRRTTKRRTRRNALQIRKNTRRRTTKRRRSTRRNALQIRKNTRRRSTRRRTTARRRRNGTKRGMRRKTARRAYSRRRNGTKRGMRRRTARKAYMKRRRNTRTKDMISKLSNKLAKIPVLGGFLSFAPYGAAAALMVEPVMMLQQVLGRYVPNMSAPLFYGAAGMVAAGLIKIAHKMFLKKFISAYTADKLAVAAASAGGAIAYYKFRSQGNVSDTVSDEMGALELRGFSGPLGLLEFRGFGGGHTQHMAGYGDYGPAAVMPLGTY